MKSPPEQYHDDVARRLAEEFIGKPGKTAAKRRVAATAPKRKVVATAPEHVRTVRDNVIDALTPEQIAQLDAIATAVLRRLDPADQLRMLTPAPTTV